YKGVKGDAINIMLAAAAYNFKRAMRVLLWVIKIICEKLKGNNFSQEYAFAKGNE
ncbi:MAG: IS5/IS1182 family transposase, partial [Porphyromonadaceae bacterium]